MSRASQFPQLRDWLARSSLCRPEFGWCSRAFFYLRATWTGVEETPEGFVWMCAGEVDRESCRRRSRPPILTRRRRRAPNWRWGIVEAGEPAADGIHQPIGRPLQQEELLLVAAVDYGRGSMQWVSHA